MSQPHLAWALVGVLVACLIGCDGTPDDDDVADDDTATDDDSGTPADDDTGTDDDTSADDDDTGTPADDDDSAVPGEISGTIELGGNITLNATSPYDVGVGLYLDEDFNPLFGPTGPPVAGTYLVVDAFPQEFAIAHGDGEQVWVAVFLDDNGSGTESGADSGDVVGFSDALVTVPAAGVHITLDFVIP